ncbi:Mannose-binding lectin [Artemisia annua]|uniref:Mannose-binding lectin n=1 Tax=Artemisia annua TaxID=35608 RepID=A0A2U1L0X8_ARTAN|nr:Mannose-binding lectin [Artemisia annua]
MTMECYERLGAFLDQLECTCGNCVQYTWVSRDIAIEDVISNGVMESNRTNHLQDCKEVAQVGIWGKQKGSPHNQWDFRLEKNHKLVKISIDHGDLIFSLKFTTQDGRGYLNESEKVGGWNGGRRVSELWDNIKMARHQMGFEGDESTKFFHCLSKSKRRCNSIKAHAMRCWVTDPLLIVPRTGLNLLLEVLKFPEESLVPLANVVTFDYDEEISGISGTVGVSRGKYAGYTIISSLSFITNKRTHGPFGQARGTQFAVPWNKGSFAGFYGLAGYYIDGIGVYLRASI